jgi:guanylate kinase
MTLEDKIKQYKPSPETIRKINEASLVIVASVVAGGKNTVTTEMIRRGGYRQIITNTTRAPRANEGVMETDGVEYHFMSLEQAEKLIDEQAFVEVKYVHGNVYGSTIAEIEQITSHGEIAIGDVDVQGVTEYLAMKPDTHAIFLLPPSVETWLARLTKRYGNLEDHAEDLAVRYQSALSEIQHVMSDQRFIVVINDDLETTVERIHGIVSGETHETSEYAAAVAEHLLDFLKKQTQIEA